MSVTVEMVSRWARSTRAFAWENFGFVPDAWQADVFDAWDAPAQGRTQRVAMQACAGPGKTAAEAICAWQFVSTKGEEGRHPNAYAISITGDNLRDNFWKEMAVWRAKSPFLMHQFEHTGSSIFHRKHPKTWWIRARAFRQTADADAKGRALSGLHAPWIAYFLDEAGDMPPQLLRTASQGLTNCEWGKIMIAGNPTSHDGALYHAVKNESHRWAVIRISGDPDDPKRSPRIDREEAALNIAQYGRNNPWVMSFILGLFPPTSVNTLLGPDDVYAAIRRVLRDEDYAMVQKRIGIDVARFGDDRTILFPRQGRRALNPIEMRNERGPQIAARVAEAKHKWGSEMELIDDTGGYGATVIDSALLAGIPMIPLNMAGVAPDPRYYNMRSYLDFKAAEWVKSGGWLPNVPGFVREATAPTYWLEGGKLRTEEKKQVKSRIGVSPDLWDAFKMTFAFPDMPASMQELVGAGNTGRSNKMLSDWDPLAN
jgi:phage terminase large subunit